LTVELAEQNIGVEFHLVIAVILKEIRMKEILLNIRDRLKDGAYDNEEHVRLSLVSRILLELGRDLWNPREVNSEFRVLPQEDRSRVDLASVIDPRCRYFFCKAGCRKFT
jgi:predicted type IV restriction endonuclease